MDLGTYTRHEGRPAIRFVRVYPQPVEQVWAALTEPDRLRRWFPSDVSLEPFVGGTVTFSGDPNLESSTGTVLAFDPPRRLAFTWGLDELYLDLESVGSGCRFTLVNVLAVDDTAARNASGWSICLTELDKALAGVQSTGPHGPDAEPFEPYYEAYVAAGVPHGAPVPRPGNPS
jgi:uncharacterized protein YndB with AHSA1/START domain